METPVFYCALKSSSDPAKTDAVLLHFYIVLRYNNESYSSQIQESVAVWIITHKNAKNKVRMIQTNRQRRRGQRLLIGRLRKQK